jgi:hypothetical protein
VLGRWVLVKRDDYDVTVELRAGLIVYDLAPTLAQQLMQKCIYFIENNANIR